MKVYAVTVLSVGLCGYLLVHEQTRRFWYAKKQVQTVLECGTSGFWRDVRVFMHSNYRVNFFKIKYLH